MPADRRMQPCPFEYYVFESRAENPTEQERASGAYLLGEAEAQHLEQFFNRLYGKTGIGIVTSDDEVITGSALLSALGATLEEAIKDVERRPEEWPVTAGYELVPFQETPGPARLRYASRSTLLEFLNRVTAMVEDAREMGGYVHFAGGG